MIVGTELQPATVQIESRLVVLVFEGVVYDPETQLQLFLVLLRQPRTGGTPLRSTEI